MKRKCALDFPRFVALLTGKNAHPGYIMIFF
jgi:hypothetical protein